MTSKRRLMRHQMQDYRNRDYCQHLLDDRIFDTMNSGEDNALGLMTTGCLDALEHMPAGAMKSIGSYFDQILTERGVSLAEMQEREAFTEQLLAELTS
jgi:hypothetical protein